MREGNISDVVATDINAIKTKNPPNANKNFPINLAFLSPISTVIFILFFFIFVSLIVLKFDFLLSKVKLLLL